MDFSSALPEGIVSDILSLTSPRDASRSSAISKGFKSVADSDAVWDRFLPSDHAAILSRSVSPVPSSTKKQLYTRLADCPILLDGGKLQSKEELVRGGGFNVDHPSLMFEISLHVSNLSGKFVWYFTQNGWHVVWKFIRGIVIVNSSSLEKAAAAANE
ncbi:hypothetical protein RHGRI_003785 [Rhododendron griersonianum]|uniref:F-box domain-containing protein n=1 Tax=Rhododendron griersonianum TaxID=479676 RepID=A0AAV6L831_9ERIC|nr:hypothetical protein RHGRI_003785 [Rhododendron griersonianum]